MLSQKLLAKFDEFPSTTQGWRIRMRPDPEGRIEPYYREYYHRCNDTCYDRAATVRADEPYPIVRKVSLVIDFDEPVSCWLHPGNPQTCCIPKHTELQFVEPPTKEQLCLRLKEICSERLEQLTCSVSPPTGS